jgi:mycothiol synthase
MQINPERRDDPRAIRHVVPDAYAQALPGLHTWMVDWAFDPSATDESAIGVLGDAMADTEGAVQVWVRHPTPRHDELAASVGLTEARDLWQVRVPLPLDEAAPDLEWQPFRPGVDEDAWMEVNNRAFAWHREQGGWTRAQIEDEEGEPWFDPAGFVMHWREGRLAGFCWTKVHDAAGDDPRMGEIYVIAADPDFTGIGLGRALTATGLDWLHRERDTPVGMLYVDADNTPAVNLYEKMGFRHHHTDRAYTRP